MGCKRTGAIAVRAGLLAGAIGLSLACEGGADPDEPEADTGSAAAHPPSLIVVTIDTLRADRLGSYGWQRANTPTLDRLAREGVRLTQATVPLPRTTPALATMLTGLWPQHHGSREVHDPMRRGRTLAEMLRARGYATRAVSANGAATPKQNLGRGFQAFRVPNDMGGDRAGRVTNHALELAREADPDAPLFLWAHYLDPHWPYDAPFAGVSPRVRKTCRSLERLPPAAMYTNRGGHSARVFEACSMMYDAEIAFTDRHVGRLLAGLRRMGRLDSRSIVVATADHGEDLGDWNHWYSHGVNVHDASMRVPLLVRGPGIEPGSTHRTVFRMEDLMPTLLSLVGVDRAGWPPMDGRDRSATLTGPPRSAGWGGVAVAESGSPLLPGMYGYVRSGRKGGAKCINGERYSLCRRPTETEPRLIDHENDPLRKRDVSDAHPEVLARLKEAAERWTAETARQRAARTPRFKLVERPRLEGGYDRVLYDLLRDPHESKDVLADHPAVARRLGAVLDEWTASLPQARVSRRSPVDVAQLRALGYVQ